MTHEQLNWTDKQWAEYFKYPAQAVPSIRKYVTENFFPVIEHDKQTGKYSFAVTRIDTSMAGTKRVLPMISDKTEFQNFESCAAHANRNVIPTLELTDFWARALSVPKTALQMLHIRER